MKTNVGSVDRVVRILAGLVILGAGCFFESWWALVGLAPILTALFRFCPAYLPLGINTGGKPTPTKGGLQLPFINVRLNADGQVTLDYYADVRADDYILQFGEQWNMMRRDPRFLGPYTFRRTDFVFTLCPGCRMPILTNRPIGKPLRCRNCETVHDTHAADGPQTQARLAELSDFLRGCSE